MTAMIVTKVGFGLGNQLFQYAAGLRLAYRLNTKLKIQFEAHGREYALDPFCISGTRITSAELMDFWGMGPSRKIRRRFRQLTGKANRKTHFKQTFHDFSADVLQIAKPYVLLDGFWQSEKYFHDAAHQVRAEFSFRSALPPASIAITRQTANLQSVAVHVRRGDYVRDDSLYALPLSYYQRAVQEVNSRVIGARFFLFSDEPDWISQHLHLSGDVVLVSGRGFQDYEELQLMTSCRHFIIANSTFSWWGAWLGKHPEKIVIAPRQWFKATSPYRSDNILPSDWLAL
jgi:hypothetical protein